MRLKDMTRIDVTGQLVSHRACRRLLRHTRALRPKGDVPMYAFGLCIDQHYFLPGLATLAGPADSLTPAARRNAAVRVLTLDLTPAQALLLSNLV